MPTKERTRRERKRKANVLGRVHGKHAAMSQPEIAALLGISTAAVQQAEARAMKKLRAHPLIREVAAELFGEVMTARE
jgi:DNA-directed RNA polymerase specialized sigma24 family protein